MRFSVLNSSSSGNCVYLEMNNKIILLDAGITYKSLQIKANKIGINVHKIDYIFITHEHTDHVLGLKSLYLKYKPTIIISKCTYDYLPKSISDFIDINDIKFISSDSIDFIGDINLEIFKTYHDSIDSVGYVLSYKDESIVYLTDTGKIEDLSIITNKSVYILESNHDREMLMNSNRPKILIDRIKSPYGHLSNNQSSVLFDKIKGDNTKAIVLYHLSSECNTKELALQEFKKVINDSKIKIYISDKTEPMELVEI